MLLRLLPLALLATLLVAPCSGQSIVAHPGSLTVDSVLTGTWTALVPTPNGQRQERFILRLTSFVDGPTNGTFELPERNIVGMPLDYARSLESSLSLAASADDLRFEGQVDRDRRQITGQFTRQGRTLPIVLRRLGVTVRPQDPVAPYPWTQRTMRIANRGGGVVLEGELILPDSVNSWPVIVMLNDDGPHDRDASRAGHRPFLVLADALARKGWATFRMDDRGIQGSTGNEALATLGDLAGDALAALRRLRATPGVDTNRIVILGHGEGGMVAAATAAQDSTIDGIVTLATPAVDGLTLLKAQIDAIERQQGTPDSVRTAFGRLVTAWMAVTEEVTSEQAAVDTMLTVTRIAIDVMPALAASPSLRPFFTGSARERSDYIRGSLLPWLDQYRQLSPGPLFRAIQRPVLALYAEHDRTVPARINAEAMQQWRPTATIRTIPGVNHQFQPCTLCTETEMSDVDQTMDPVVWATILEWIAAVGRDGND